MRLAPAALTILLFAIAPASATAIQHVTPVYVVIVKGTPVPTPRRVAVHHSVTWFNNDKELTGSRATTDAGLHSRAAVPQTARCSLRPPRPLPVQGRREGARSDHRGRRRRRLQRWPDDNALPLRRACQWSRAKHQDIQRRDESRLEWRGDTHGRLDVGFQQRDAEEDFRLRDVCNRSSRPGSARGTTDATYDFKETRGDIYGPCQGTLSFDNLGTHLLLGGSRGSGKNQFTFWSQLDLEEGTRISNEIRSQSQAACPGHLGKTLPSWNGGDFSVQGLTFKPFNALLELHADRSDRAASLWFPLKQLSAGAPFTLETGIKSNAESCGSTCNAEEFLRLHADIKRHR